MRNIVRPERMRWEEVRFQDQIVRRHGNGNFVPVDIETGFLGRYSTYEPLAELLAQNNGDVTLAERPGFGGSKPLPGPCEVDKHVELKLERLRQRRIENCQPNQRFVLVGHSMGSAITAAFAARHPDYVASIIDIGGIGEPHPDWRFSDWDIMGVQSMLPSDTSFDYLKQYAHTAIVGYFDVVVSVVTHPLEVLGHAQLCRQLDNSEAEMVVGEHGIPVLMVRGDHDKWVGAEAMAARADRMGVPAEGEATPLSGRHTLPRENHFLGNITCPELDALIAGHMDIAVDLQLADMKVAAAARTAAYFEGNVVASAPEESSIGLEPLNR